MNLLPVIILAITFLPVSAQNSPKKKTFTFINSTGNVVNDLHIRLSQGGIPVNKVVDSATGIQKVGGVFAGFPGNDAAQHDYDQGQLQNGDSVTIQFSTRTRIQSWYWTINGVREGATQNGLSDDLTFLANTRVPGGGAVVNLPAYASAGSLILENVTEQMVFGLTATVWNPEEEGDIAIVQMEVLGHDGLNSRVDDNYDGQLSDSENDHLNDPEKPFCRSIFNKGLRKNRSVELRYELSEFVPPGTQLHIRFNKKQEETHYDILSGHEMGIPGETSAIFMPVGTQQGSFKIYNNSDNFLAVAVLPPAEYFFEQLQLEPPYQNSEASPASGGETVLFFDPPLPPYDYAAANFKLPEPLPLPFLPMSMIPLETFPHECDIQLEDLDVSVCNELNYYQLGVKAELQSQIRDCREYVLINSLDQAASDLHAIFSGTGGSLEVVVVDHASGCSNSEIPSNGTVTNQMDIIWDGACVDPGESVKVKVCTENGPLRLEGGYWTLHGESIGELKQADIGEGIKGGQSQKGIGITINGVLQDILQVNNGVAAGQLTLPADGALQELFIEPVVEAGCSVVATDVFESPLCTNETIMADCDDIGFNGEDVPVDMYPVEHIFPNQARIIENSDNFITNISVIPPQLIDEGDAYICGEDYRVLLSAEGFPAKMVVLEFTRSGPYFVELVYESGMIERRTYLVDERFLPKIRETASCSSGVYHEFPCQAPDIAVVSDPLGFEHSWGEEGAKARNLKAAADSICAAAQAKGGPVEVVIDGHGGPGFITIGTERLNCETAEEFIKAVKGKISELTLLSCGTASGAEGEALICKLRDSLNITVKGFTAHVGDIFGPPARWFSAGEEFVKSVLSSLPEVQTSTWNVKVYPNPVRDLLQLEFRGRAPRKIGWQLLSAQGHIMAAQESLPTSESAAMQLIMQPYPAGLYYLRIGSEQDVVVKKVVKVD